MEDTIVANKHIGMDPFLIESVHNSIDIASDNSPMPDRNIVTKEDLTFEIDKKITCNGSIGGNKNIANNDWSQIVELEHCSGFGILFGILADSLKFFGGEHVTEKGAIEYFVDHGVVSNYYRVNIYTLEYYNG
jgi:hypothetical protein